jgi:alkylation response protein AidB-like acyl-CoA dehydrogenase
MSLDAATLAPLIATPGRALPLPGSGQTWCRFAALAAFAAEDLSVGRLAEGHADALAILAEADAHPIGATSVYGVWAARSGTRGTTARREGSGWRLTGQKPFCSGNGIIDRALVTAETEDGYRLFDIALDENVIDTVPGSWPAVGMADSASNTLEFGGPLVPPERAIGPPGFYLDRAGFWFGAVGVAACWYGGARGLVDQLVTSFATAPTDVITAELGRAAAHVRGMELVLESAARDIDADPGDREQQARELALSVRFAVHHGATQVLNHIAAAGGAGPLCHDRAQSRRAADLFVYLAQHHGPLDAVELGRLALDGRA